MSAANMVVISLTVALFLSTLVIAEVHNTEGELSMDDTQASWFGSLPFFCQPIGSLASGVVVQWLGRKKSLFLINIPYFIGCIIIYVSPSITVLFLANILLGITVGFTEAPINSYFGEICQPNLRSILAGSAAIFYQSGMFLLFVLGSLTHWRTTAAIVSVIPILSMVLLYKVPESPIWLVAQGRMKDAESALCWLRGWVDPSAIQQELSELVKYHETVTLKYAARDDHTVENMKSSEEWKTTESVTTPEMESLLTPQEPNEKQDIKETQIHINHQEMNEVTPKILNEEDQSTLTLGNVQWVKDTKVSDEENTSRNGKAFSSVVAEEDKVTIQSKIVNMAKLLMEPETRRPLVLTVSYFMFYGMGAMPSIRPFLIEVIDSFHVPISGSWSSVVMASTGFLGSIILISVVNRFGKRIIALTTTAICAASCLLLGLYAYLFIVPAARTGDESYLVATWLPLVIFAVFSFFNIIQGQIPWLLVAEAFPFRTRGVAGGMAAASNYVISFIAARTFLSTEHSLKLYGSFWFFGAINCLCFVFLYFQLPETEGKTLEEIERLFAGKKERRK